MLEIKINISEEQILELIKTKKTIKKSLPIEISLSYPRKEALAKKVNNKKKQSDYIFNSDHRKLIDAWNDSEYIKNCKERRNSKIETSQARASIPLFNKAIKKVGMNRLLETMTNYFDFCGKGKHIWSGTNHGFQNLRGFINRMIKDDDTPWWELYAEKSFEDTEPTQTLFIANTFSKKFLGRTKFGLKNPSPDYHNFLRARKWIDQISKSGKYNLSKGQLLNELINCVEDGCRKPIISAYFCSDRTWSILMPQWLKAKYG